MGRAVVGIFLYFQMRLSSWCLAGLDLGTGKGGRIGPGRALKTRLAAAAGRRGGENM